MGQRSSGHWLPNGKIVIGAALLTVAPMLAHPVLAAKSRHPQTAHAQNAPQAVDRSARIKPTRYVTANGELRRTSSASLRMAGFQSHSKKYALKGGKARYAYARPRLQCVSFARAASGIDLKGNAVNWWDAASGIYERGNRPEPGSVLNFRSTGQMRLGHVAVVAAVDNNRQIEIDHANWPGPGRSKAGVSRNIPVIDVSPANDWSAVRVGLGRGGDFGSIYPTYGFIYDRADRGIMVANERASGPSSTVLAIDELAEAPAQPTARRQQPIDLNLEGPSRGLR